MEKRSFFTAGYLAIIGYVILLWPYVTGIDLAFHGMWWFLLISPFMSYLFYAECCNWFCFRVISIANGFIYASRSYTPYNSIQHRCKVNLSDVVFADFCFVQGNSKGKEIRHVWDAPCLSFTLSNETIERIVLLGYSKKQIKKIEKALIEECPDILFYHNSNNIFIK